MKRDKAVALLVLPLLLGGFAHVLFAQAGTAQEPAVSLLQAEAKMLRSTNVRYRARVTDLKKQLQELNAENKRLRSIIAKTLPAIKLPSRHKSAAPTIRVQEVKEASKPNAGNLKEEIDLQRSNAKRYRSAVTELEKLTKGITAENEQLRLTIARTVPTHRADSVQDATYLVIPLKGGIGIDFTAGQMKRSLRYAVELLPSVVVLDIDTPGGSTQETEKILAVMKEFRGLRFVALVRKALSAGATITLACPEIYVTEDAVIGAAVPYYLDKKKIPRELQEKFKSVWRAACRKAAEHGGHSPLLAEAMVDSDFALTMRKENGQVIIERDGKGKVIKARGKILALTAREALECRLAKGLVADYESLGKALKMDGWRQVESQTFAHPKTEQFTPRVLYDKARLFGLTGQKLTRLQVDKALKGWREWLENEKVVGRHVRWSLTLVEASENTKGISQLEVLYEKAKRARDHYVGASKRYTAERRSLQKNFATVARHLQQARKYSMMVVGVSVETPRAIVIAHVNKSSKKHLTSLFAGGQLILEGDIVGIKLGRSGDGQLALKIGLKKSELAVPEK